MKPLAQLDQLNLDAHTKQQVTGIVQALLDQAQQAIRAQELKIQAFTMELAHLRRIQFGKKNESLSSQPSLFEESVLADIAAVHAEIEQIDVTVETNAPKAPRVRAGRQPLPDHLPRIEYRHEPESCQCGQCGSKLIKIGEDVTEQLDVEPARFFVHRHIRPQYACKSCETVTAEPVPPAIIDGGMAAPGLLAWVITSKYLNHLPLYHRTVRVPSKVSVKSACNSYSAKPQAIERCAQASRFLRSWGECADLVTILETATRASYHSRCCSGEKTPLFSEFSG